MIAYQVPDDRKKQIERVLEDGCKSSDVIAHEMCVSRSLINQYISILRDEKLMHIGDWGRRGNALAPLHAWGFGVDMPRPPRLRKGVEQIQRQPIDINCTPDPLHCWLFSARNEGRLAA